MNVFDFADQLIKFSQAHPFFSIAVFVLIWIYAVTVTYRTLTEAEEKLLLIQKHIVEIYVLLGRASGINQLPPSDIQFIYSEAVKERNGFLILIGLGIFVPINIFVIITQSPTLIILIILGDLSICYLIYRALKLQKERQKRLEDTLKR